MVINGLKISGDGIVHENEDRMVLEVFNDDKDNNKFLARNCRVFIVTRDSWIGDHHRKDWETYSVLRGKVHWFFENMKNGERESHIIGFGGKVEIPPMVAHALKVKKGTIVLGRYSKSFQELKTSKHILEWARKEKIKDE